MNTKKVNTIVLLSMLLTTFLAASSITQVSAAVPGWGVKITATLSLTNPPSATCTFGIKTGATNSFDEALGDQAAPIAPPEGVAAWFAYPSEATSALRKLSTSYISDSGTPSWTYRVQTISVEGTMTLSWSASDIANVPSGFNIYLANSAGTTTLADMKTVTSYSYFAGGDSTQTFIILLVPTTVVPEYPIAVAASVIALTACFAALGITKIVRHKKYNLTVPSF
jgi:hypothetical protein